MNDQKTNAQPIEGQIREIAMPLISNHTTPEAFIELMEKGHEINAGNSGITTALTDNHGVVTLPDDFKLHDLERFQPTRRRARGTMTTPFIEPFAQYAKAYANPGANVFVNAAKMQAVAVLDLGTHNIPGHADHRAVLEPTRTAAYQALLGMTQNGPRSQKDVAEFFEDWPQLLSFFNEELQLIATRQAIATIRSLTIESVAKLNSEEQSLNSQRSAFESVTASSKNPIPTLIHFECQPYADLQARTFVLRLAIVTGDKLPRISLRIQNLEQHNEEMANELADLVRTDIAGAMPVLIGTYSKEN